MSSGRGYGGRFQQHGRQQQGTGNGKNERPTSNKPAFKPTKKTLNDNIYYLWSAKQADDCKRTTDFLINNTRKTFVIGNNVAIE
jgi:hypothetical protein